MDTSERVCAGDLLIIYVNWAKSGSDFLFFPPHTSEGNLKLKFCVFTGRESLDRDVL